MVLVLCIGDLHVPHRAQDMPAKFKELLKPGKVDHILCCGNLCSRSLLDYLRGICADVKLVAGDFDDHDAPEQLVVTIGDIRAVMYGERLQINPGSATGAYSALTPDAKPSFVLMDIDGAKARWACLPATVYVYQLVDGAVKVEKIDYTKPGAPPAL
ncbi:vacuolar sorting-associated protein [Raphidocelis subcapitata]|uniref:Vacuolar protein sorting-associated protein 29 n=1 Tax=Raphidocelis subcapitata TaxID=307507 RepID=A0A2V0NQ14_9CHLO|nr:vacuolar sorting-associated protein [Raphidocelis subcapitata]|eukprot:GBF88662.1 vacuolar sorting-associated protein [Raphidocelis subcapitata]